MSHPMTCNDASMERGQTWLLQTSPVSTGPNNGRSLCNSIYRGLDGEEWIVSADTSFKKCTRCYCFTTIYLIYKRHTVCTFIQPISELQWTHCPHMPKRRYNRTISTSLKASRFILVMLFGYSSIYKQSCIYYSCNWS